jgi:putative membrane protein insertion efficiency factor
MIAAKPQGKLQFLALSYIMKHLFIFLITIYQRCISPVFGGKAVCRFVPTCSEYAKQAIEKHGGLRGTIMAIKRIARCRPGGGFGYDPVE